MSMPNVPDIKPDIDICGSDVIKLLLASIALEEISLSHVINAEAEKAQFVLAKHPPLPIVDLITESEDRVLKDAIIKEILLLSKFEHTLEIEKRPKPPKVHKNKATASGVSDGEVYEDSDYAHYWHGIPYK